MILEVHQHKIDGKLLNYNTVPKDCEGWADAKKFAPAKYELAILRLVDRKTVMGWWTGHEYMGQKLADREVIQWKKGKETSADEYFRLNKHRDNDSFKGIDKYWK